MAGPAVAVTAAAIMAVETAARMMVRRRRLVPSVAAAS
jgi:hypothetical protein